MDWQDDQFESFLRQFRPPRPKPLQTPRPRWLASLAIVASAAAIVGVVTVAVWRASNPVAVPRSVPAQTSPVTQPQPSNVEKPESPVESAPSAAPSTSPNLSFRPRTEIQQRPSPSDSPVPDMPGNRRRVGGAVAPPTKTFDVRPVYPPDALAAGITGTVVLGIVIGEDGSVIEVEVLRSIPELDQAAIDAVRQWRFEPTVLDGRPIEVEMAVSLQFYAR